MTTSSLYFTHAIICKVPQSSSEFQTQPQKPGRFSNASQRKDLLVVKIPVRMVKLLITLYGVSIHPVTYKDTGILPNYFVGEEGNRSGISP
jgi:hypothetical protein